MLPFPPLLSMPLSVNGSIGKNRTSGWIQHIVIIASKASYKRI
jgi:hypothetical protein